MFSRTQEVLKHTNRTFAHYSTSVVLLAISRVAHLPITEIMSASTKNLPYSAALQHISEYAGKAAHPDGILSIPVFSRPVRSAKRPRHDTHTANQSGVQDHPKPARRTLDMPRTGCCLAPGRNACSPSRGVGRLPAPETGRSSHPRSPREFGTAPRRDC